MTALRSGIGYALLAAVLFGASTPLAKLLGARLSPTLLAGLLYAGSGLGLTVCVIGRFAWLHVRHRSSRPFSGVATLGRTDAAWLAGAILAGGIAAPLLLLAGLQTMAASHAALLLNLEGVLTALLAWGVFHEHLDRRLLLGMTAIVTAGVLLSWGAGTGFVIAPGAVAISGACLCWAIDNNLTRKVAASDALQIAAWKGMVAGSVNLGAAFLLGDPLPAPALAMAAGLLGLCGYGLSLVLFVLALRALGSARTGAYFSAAPFIGAALAVLLLHEATPPLFWFALALMAGGLWLHLTERHQHAHQHVALRHTHAHRHDGLHPDPHHGHEHPFVWSATTLHTHAHEHQAIAHSHAHFPDLHHRHRHDATTRLP